MTRGERISKAKKDGTWNPSPCKQMSFEETLKADKLHLMAALIAKKLNQ